MEERAMEEKRKGKGKEAPLQKVETTTRACCLSKCGRLDKRRWEKGEGEPRRKRAKEKGR